MALKTAECHDQQIAALWVSIFCRWQHPLRKCLVMWWWVTWDRGPLYHSNLFVFFLWFFLVWLLVIIVAVVLFCHVYHGNKFVFFLGVFFSIIIIIIIIIIAIISQAAVVLTVWNGGTMRWCHGVGVLIDSLHTDSHTHISVCRSHTHISVCRIHTHISRVSESHTHFSHTHFLCVGVTHTFLLRHSEMVCAMWWGDLFRDYFLLSRNFILCRAEIGLGPEMVCVF